MQSVLAAGGGFLLAVLWMDLMFDVQVLAHASSRPLPEAVVTSIAAYYRRVTTDARPLSFLVGTVMLVVVGGSLWDLVRAPAWPRALALLLAAAPVGLALTRVLPNAVRLGARSDPPEMQAALARTICTDHLLCLAAIALFVALQVGATGRDA